MSTGAAVLCAGAGSRYLLGPRERPAEHKLLVPFRGRPLVCWAFQHAVEARLAVTLAITGAVDLAAVLPEGVIAVYNPRWEGGIATSVGAAVTAARDLGLDTLVIGLGDQPLVPAAAWRAVAACSAPVAVATYSGVRRNPVRLARAVWDELPLSGDEGARALMRRRPELVVEVPCEGDPVDVDTVEDLPAPA